MAYPDRMAIETEWTAEMLLALPEDHVRRELLDGELVVMPAPSLAHQQVVGVLYRLLHAHVQANGLGSIHMSPADIVFSPRRLVQPDVFVAPLVDGRRARSWTEIRALRLAVEVSSPTTARYDRITKRHIYMSEDVDEYWIVDLDAQVVERWRRGDDRPEVIDGVLTWQPVPEVPALVIDLPVLFEEALA
jgi:Uma2 family endonuclease